MNRNQKTLDEFVEYCKANPNYRFWQALRNWVGTPFLLISEGLPQSGQKDTFHWEGKDK